MLSLAFSGPAGAAVYADERRCRPGRAVHLRVRLSSAAAADSRRRTGAVPRLPHQLPEDVVGRARAFRNVRRYQERRTSIGPDYGRCVAPVTDG